MRLHKPDVRMVATGDLVVDDEYQRDAISAHIGGIAKHFDDEAFGLIHVGERDDGTLCVLDGFQRLNAAMERGITHVPCHVTKSRGRQHEAELFGKDNKRRGLSTHQLFKAEVSAGKPDAVAVYAAVTAAGLNVRGMKSNGRRQSIGGIKQCQNAYRRMGGGDAGAAHVTEVLKTLRVTWGEQHPETAYHCAVIGGLAFFLRRFGDRVVRKRIIEKMERLTPNKLMGLYGDIMKMMSGTTRDEGVGRAFFTVYNKGLRSPLDWEDDRVDIEAAAA